MKIKKQKKITAKRERRILMQQSSFYNEGLDAASELLRKCDDCIKIYVEDILDLENEEENLESKFFLMLRNYEEFSKLRGEENKIALEEMITKFQNENSIFLIAYTTAEEAR